VALSLLALSAVAVAAQPAVEKPRFKEALTNGKTTIYLRYRYEDVSDDAIGDKHARASTLRTALGYRSQAYRGFTFEVEAESVAAIGHELYDNRGAARLNNFVRDRPAVADPADTGINQALLRYRWQTWQVVAGRQEIVLGDERFVGNVGWRQNHQSFDALRIDSWVGGLRFTYAFVDRVQRVFGDSQDLAGHLFNVHFDLQNVGKFTFYGYLLDYQDRNAVGLSTATWGLEFAGSRRLTSSRSLIYEIERAEQSDHADNPRTVDAGYTSLMLGASLPRLTVKLGWEQLDGGIASGQFRTPLATPHRHNGWADRFPVTPLYGLEDLYIELSGKLGKVDWLARYHDFEAESRPIPYGEELDLQLVYTSPGGLLFGLKGALYNADQFAADTDKWMVWSEYSF
jgi:hypothetical protein